MIPVCSRCRKISVFPICRACATEIESSAYPPDVWEGDNPATKENWND